MHENILMTVGYGRDYGNDFQAMYENMLMTVGYGRNYGNGRRPKNGDIAYMYVLNAWLVWINSRKRQPAKILTLLLIVFIVFN